MSDVLLQRRPWALCARPRRRFPLLERPTGSAVAAVRRVRRPRSAVPARPRGGRRRLAGTRRLLSRGRRVIASSDGLVSRRLRLLALELGDGVAQNLDETPALRAIARAPRGLVRPLVRELVFHS